jgi:hypothetical protein
MKTHTSWFLLLLLFVTQLAWAGGDPQCAPPPLESEVLSGNADVSDHAIATLRERGYAGLDSLLAAYREKIESAKNTDPLALSRDTQWQRVRHAIDEVAQQRDAYASRLYWFTDLEKAKAEARVTGRPILSLRLLGKLDEEFSCANSRFFRTVLYANSEVSQRLRDKFVLHWESVRPAPRITIDYGDGRKLERTITGNSIHYILDSEGRVIDALPGLYAPTAFVESLDAAEKIAHEASAKPDAERLALLSQYHRDAGGTINARWEADAHAAGLSLTLMASGDAAWSKIAALHRTEARLDSGSRELIRVKNPTATQAAVVATSKCLVEDPMLRAIRNFEQSIAVDTAQNEYLLHSKIHEWLAQSPATDLRHFNNRVYAELFLTPNSDAWLGLAPTGIYSALDGEGKTVASE